MTVRQIDPEEARRLLDSGEGYSYLDVRTEDEFSSGHVPGAVNVPLLRPGPEGLGLRPNDSFLEDVEMELEPSTPIIVGCLRGARSLKAAQILVEHGFTHVLDMRGGFEGELDERGATVFRGWVARGLPTTTL